MKCRRCQGYAMTDIMLMGAETVPLCDACREEFDNKVEVRDRVMDLCNARHEYQIALAALNGGCKEGMTVEDARKASAAFLALHNENGAYVREWLKTTPQKAPKK